MYVNICLYCIYTIYKCVNEYILYILMQVYIICIKQKLKKESMDLKGVHEMV